MKRHRMGVAGVILSIFAAGAVFAGQPAASGKQLVVGVMPSTIGAPVQYAFDKGYYDEVGLKVKIMVFPSGAPINEAVSAKQLDIACSGAASIFSLASGECQLLAEVNRTGGLGIWVRPGNPILTVKGKVPGYPELYGSAETIRGQKFLANLGTAPQFNVLRYIQRFGLTEGDIQIIHMEFGPGAQAFIAGEGDAIATFAPYYTQVEEKAKGIKIASLEDSAGLSLYDVFFTRKDVVKARRADVVLFLRATYKAMDELADDKIRSEFAPKWYAENGRTPTKESFDNELRDRRYMTKELMEKPDYVFGESQEEYAGFNAEIGKIMDENLPNVKDAIDPSLLNEALGFTVKSAK